MVSHSHLHWADIPNYRGSVSRPLPHLLVRYSRPLSTLIRADSPNYPMMSPLTPHRADNPNYLVMSLSTPQQADSPNYPVIGPLTYHPFLRSVIAFCCMASAFALHDII